MEFANPGLLGSAKAFRERYAVPVERHGSAEAAQELRPITEPFVLRPEDGQVDHLRPAGEAGDEGLVQPDPGTGQPPGAPAGRRFPAGRAGKLARLEEICEEIDAEGDRALCFTQYAEFGRMLQPYLAARTGCEVLFLHGGTTKRQRDAMVARFQQADEPLLFLLSLKAGGTGLNLTSANHVIHIDRW